MLCKKLAKLLIELCFTCNHIVIQLLIELYLKK